MAFNELLLSPANSPTIYASAYGYMAKDMSQNIMISFLGTALDGGFKDKRKERWRPNVGAALADDPCIDRLILLHDHAHARLAERVAEDAEALRDGFKVELMEVESNPFELRSTFTMVLQLSERIKFDPDNRYFLNISTGTHIHQISFFLIAESRRWPVKLVQCVDAKTEDLASRIQVIDLDLSRYDEIMNRYPVGTAEGVNRLKRNIPTRNVRYNTLIEKIQTVALRSRSPILLTGPTGAGKTAMARLLHSTKSETGLLSGEFVEVNCSTLRGDTVISTLFGHKKGAFTGALKDRDGLLKAADKGLLFLDEIGELGLQEQAMLLHALEDKIFTPLGSEKEVSSDFQLIAGTNCDLEAMVKEGRFREDLLARINTWAFEMPSLRDRLEDLEPNLEYELSNARNALPGERRLLPQAKKLYLDFATSAQALWAGNFRDLSASVERMITLSKRGVIDEEVVQDEISTLRQKWGGSTGTPKSAESTLNEDLVEIVLPGNSLNPFEKNQLNFVIRIALISESYADLSRRLYGDKAGEKNPAQKSRNYLQGYGLALGLLKTSLAGYSEKE